MNDTIPTTAQILRAILARQPRATIHDIHHAHPRLRAMTLDRLGLLLERLIVADDLALGR